YRVILSNPPYVPEWRMAELPLEYAHEPKKALTGGRDGLEVVRRILSEAPGYLETDGVLILEVGEAADRLLDAYPRLPFTWLDFESGGDGVLLLTRDELTGY
ncbi:MAG TPA: 50S ribosomal protein L3 N(5)-glutamine methyltransferase, partial [Gammaproteobacteria bacterium]